MFQIASPTAIPVFPPQLSATAQSFLSRCFVKDPTARASAEELIKHPFVLYSAEQPHASAAATTGNSTNRHLHPAGAGTSPRCKKVVGALLSDELSTARSQNPADDAVIGTPRLETTRSSIAHTCESEGQDSPAYSMSSGAALNSSAQFSTRDNIDRDNIDRDECIDSNDELEGAVEYSSDEEAEDGLPSIEVVSISQSHGVVRAIGSYQAEEESELTLQEGMLIEVTEMAPSGWWRGQLTSSIGSRQAAASGWFPSTYVQWVIKTNSE